MGLKLRLNLFHEVEARDVYRSYEEFYLRRGKDLHVTAASDSSYTLHERENNWTVLEWNGGWEWIIRRQAQLHVSSSLGCMGFLIFVYDGDYWGYEFFKNGRALDHFVQDEVPPDGSNWFPSEACQGNSKLISRALPFLSASEIEKYLIQNPEGLKFPEGMNETEEDLEIKRRWEMHKRLDIPARPGDRYSRFDECAVFDFLSLLGVSWSHQQSSFAFPAPSYRSFGI